MTLQWKLFVTFAGLQNKVAKSTANNCGKNVVIAVQTEDKNLIKLYGLNMIDAWYFRSDASRGFKSKHHVDTDDDKPKKQKKDSPKKTAENTVVESDQEESTTKATKRKVPASEPKSKSLKEIVKETNVNKKQKESNKSDQLLQNAVVTQSTEQRPTRGGKAPAALEEIKKRQEKENESNNEEGEEEKQDESDNEEEDESKDSDPKADKNIMEEEMEEVPETQAEKNN